jgi:mRNA interferase RelE/StbE
MRWQVGLTGQAERQLRKLARAAQQRIGRAIDGLETDPFAGDVKKLAGAEQLWRLRVGDYRIIYEIDKGRLLVLVIRIADRREAYR